MKLLIMLLASLGLFSGSIYPQAMTVVSVEDDIVTMETSTGHLFQMYGADDWEVGDLAAVMLFDNGTERIEDDAIIAARYAG